jgi:hypothetical protein
MVWNHYFNSKTTGICSLRLNLQRLSFSASFSSKSVPSFANFDPWEHHSKNVHVVKNLGIVFIVADYLC